MVSVIDFDVAKKLDSQNMFYIMHRFGDNITYDFVHYAQSFNIVSISVGVNEGNIEENALKALSSYGSRIDYITIDVAHGDHLKVRERIKFLENYFPKSIIIAGNVASFDAYRRLCDWGADAIKVGIGQGSICTTRFKTGFSVPMFTCVKDIADKALEVGYDQPIIADGGIQDIGDISKALVAGASMVMCGGLFAKCSDSPAKIVDGKKQYFGSTSYEAKGHKSYIEGKLLEVEIDPPIMERVKEIKMGLQSAVSYSGGNDLSGFKNVNYTYIR